jgi:hypothetical protein
VNSEYFGCYYKFYGGGGHRYLDLLRLFDKNEAKESIDILYDICKSPDWENDSIKLLRDNNWRGHLAPLVAFVISGGKKKDIEIELWSCVKNGSWVIPQIIAGLHLVNVDVVKYSVDIIMNGISNKDIDPVRAHVEMGPGDNNSRLGKIMNSLIGLGLREKIPMGSVDIDRIVMMDIDNSDNICLSWHKSMLAVLTRA